MTSIGVVQRRPECLGDLFPRERGQHFTAGANETRADRGMLLIHREIGEAEKDSRISANDIRAGFLKRPKHFIGIREAVDGIPAVKSQPQIDSFKRMVFSGPVDLNNHSPVFCS